MMSDTEAPSPINNHTLAYLRRLDQRQGRLLELFIRQQDLIGRLDRNMREGFETLQKQMDSVTSQMQGGFARLERGFSEVRNDIITLENGILNRSSEHYESSVRLNQHDDRIAALEAAVFVPKP
jgi:hypothetical protein